MPSMNPNASFKGMGPILMEKISSISLNTEILYSFIIILCSLMIYFGTKEIYELSKHKGIKYFRISFLFFAIAYFFRSFIKIILLSFNMREIRQIEQVFGNVTLFLFVYFSSIAILYLLYSVSYKKWNKNKAIQINLIGITLSIISIILRSPETLITINILLLMLIIISISLSSKKKNKLHIIYILISIFWTLNTLDILIPNILDKFSILFYLSSSLIFLIMLYKVLKKTGD